MVNNITPKYIEVANQIRVAIQTKRYTGKLPGERALAESHNVSYMTVRKAVDLLVEEGLLVREAQKGTFIQTTPKKNRHRLIGFFLDRNIKNGISSSYYSLIFKSLVKEAGERGCEIIFFNDEDPNSFIRTLKRLDGVIATCREDTDKIILSMAEKLPVVTIDNNSANKTIPSVTLENFDALVSSVNLLAELGHTRIGFMRGLADSDVGRDRHAGYVHGIQRNHLKLEEGLIYNGDFSFESGRLGIKNFLDKGTLPTALICANDEMALGAIKELKKHNLRVPDDVSITGFDDIDVAGQVTPALTTLKAPTKDIAANALSLLNDLVTGKDIAQKSITLPCKMIVRETCSTPLKTPVKKTG